MRRLVLALAAAASQACGGDAASTRQVAATLAVGDAAPAYAATALDGRPVTLAALRGEVVLLNVWATWCQPCREEIPALDSLHREFGARGLRVIGVSIDVSGDASEIAGFARELGASYALWLDPDDRVSTAFRAVGVPSTVLIDRDGVLRWRHMGPVRAADPALRALLDSTLAR
jgi:peroxiredoxin